MSKIPEETAGPYPGDGSNGPNALRTTGVVRNDIRSSFGGLSGSVRGVPLNVELTIVSASTCTPLANYAVYLWHCDAAGNYSLYSSGVTNQNWVSNKIPTSQIALPKASCDLVYATSGYSSSTRNLSQISLATDNVFSDGASLELATVTGDVTNGMTATLTVAV